MSSILLAGIVIALAVAGAGEALAVPVITFDTVPVTTVEFGSDYVPAAATCELGLSVENPDVVINGVVNATILGSYDLVYTCTDYAGAVASETVAVEVVDTDGPDITVTGRPANLNSDRSDPYHANNVQATCKDDVTGDTLVVDRKLRELTRDVDLDAIAQNIAGQYRIVFTCVGSNEETTTRTIILRYADFNSSPFPDIILNGERTVSVQVGSDYVDAGATCIKMTSASAARASQLAPKAVDVSTIGAKTVAYTGGQCSDFGFNADTARRTVNVIDDTTPPTLAITGDNPLSVQKGEDYVELGAVCDDNVDADKAAEESGDTIVTSTIGASFTRTYSCTDAAGNGPTTGTRTVNIVADTTPPEIIPRVENQTVLIFTDYRELGALCTDNADADKEADIGGDRVDFFVVGSYDVEYTCTDSSDNIAAAKTITITVIEDDMDPVVNIRGSSPTLLVPNIPFEDPGAFCTDASIFGLKEATFSGTVGTTPGTYPVTYTCIDENLRTATKVRNVTVIEDDTRPDLVVTAAPAPATEGIYPVNDPRTTPYSVQSTTCIDDYLGDLSGEVTSTASNALIGPVSEYVPELLGTTTITYSCSDTVGAATEQHEVRSTPSYPSIILKPYVLDGVDLGAGPVDIPFGSQYADPGAHCMTGTAVSDITSPTTVDTSVSGLVNVAYDCTRNSEAATQVIRPVTVLERPATLDFDGSEIFLRPQVPGTIPITCADRNGMDISSQITANTTISTGGPTVTVTIPAGTADGPLRIQYSCSDAEPVTVEVIVDGTRPVLQDFPLNVGLTDADPADYTFRLACTDENLEGSEWTGLRFGSTVLPLSVESISFDQTGRYVFTYECTDKAGNTLAPGGNTHDFIVQNPNGFNPTIEILGDDPLIIDLGSEFVDPGATCVDPSASNGAAKANTIELDVNTAGSYRVFYWCLGDDGDVSYSAARQVIVRDTSDTTNPVLTLEPPTMVYVNLTTSYTPTLTCIDDGTDISGQITPKDYVFIPTTDETLRVQFDCADYNGNDAPPQFLDIIADGTDPVFGANPGPASIAFGDTVDESTFVPECTDANFDRTILKSVTLGGSPATFSSSIAGDYIFTYECLDKAENSATQTFATTVNPAPGSTTNPELSEPAETTVYVKRGDSIPAHGLTCFDGTVELTSSITQDITPDITTDDSYVVTFTCTDADSNTDTKIITYIVDGVAPVITPATGTVTIELGADTYTAETPVCNDPPHAAITTINTAGDTAVDATTIGEYPVTHDCTDMAGNDAATVTRTFSVVDTTDPQAPTGIRATVSLTTAETYTEDAFTCAQDAGTAVTAQPVIYKGSNDVVIQSIPQTVGTYFAEFTCEDAAGNSQSATQSIEIVAKNVITFPTTTSGSPHHIRTDATEPVTCSDPASLVSDPPFSSAAESASVVETTYTCGNADSQTVHYIFDNTPPTITPATGTVTIELGTDTYTAETPVCGDPPHAAITTIATVGDTAVDATTIGEYPVTHDCTDRAGNDAATVTRTFSVVDTTDPQAPTGIRSTVSLTTAETYTEDAFTCPSDSGTAITPSVVYRQSDGTIIQSIPQTAGTYSAEFTCTDAEDNSVFAEQSITITQAPGSTTTPDISPPPEATVYVKRGDPIPAHGLTCLDGTVDLTSSITQDITPDITTDNSYLVTFTCTDADGNIDTEMITYIVDGVAPVITPATGTVTIELGTDTYTAETPVCNDPPHSPITTINTAGNTAVDDTVIDDYEVTHDCTDRAGNDAATVTRTFSVVDTTDPAPPANFRSEVTLSTADTYTVDAFTCAQDAGTTVTKSIVYKQSDGTIIQSIPQTVGTYFAEFTCEDAAGNSQSATQSIEIVAKNVITSPSSSPSSPHHIRTDATEPVTCSDPASLVSDPPFSSATESASVVETTYTCGNADSQTVHYIFDNTPPTITPATGTVTLELGTDTYTAETPVCNDPPHAAITTINTAGDTAVDATTIGEYPVTHDCTDRAGNDAATVTRTFSVVDTTDPQAPTGIRSTVSLTTAETYTVDAFTCPSDSGTAITPSVVYRQSDGTIIQSIPQTAGTYSAEFTCTDAEDNSVFAEQSITITQASGSTQKPVIGGDSTAYAKPEGEKQISLTCTDTDGSEIPGSITVRSGPAVSTATPGQFTITGPAEHDAEAEAVFECTSGGQTGDFTVTIVADGEFPVVDTSFTRTLSLNSEPLDLNETPVCSDNNPGVAAGGFHAHLSGSIFTPSVAGDHSVFVQCTDAAGNIAIATVTISVTSSTDPIINAPDSPIHLRTNSEIPVTCAGGTLSDPTPALDPTAESTEPVTVTYTCGTASEELTFVFDDTAPIVVINGDDPLYLQPVDGAAFSAIDPKSVCTDAHPGAIKSNSSDSDAESISADATFTVTYTCTDLAENPGTATRSVTVDGTAPVFDGLAPIDIIVGDEFEHAVTCAEPAGSNGAPISGPVLERFDSGGTLISEIPTDEPGDYTVVFTCEDAAENSAASAAQAVSVRHEIPIFTGSLATTHIMPDGEFTLAGLTCTDGGVNINDRIMPNATELNKFTEADGQVTVEFTCTDEDGHEAENTISVTVAVDGTQPTIDQTFYATVALGSPTLTKDDYAALCTDQSPIIDTTIDFTTIVGGSLSSVTMIETDVVRQYLISFSCTDKAGNGRSSSFNTAIVDQGTTPVPVFALSGDLPDPSYTNNPENFDYTSITCTKDGAQFNEGVMPNVTLAGLTDGTYPVTFECKEDGVGAAPETESILLVVDTILPVISLPNATIRIEIGADTYTAESVTCADPPHDPITPVNTVGDSDVNDTKIDLYPVTHDCTDRAQNEADTVIRVFNVTDTAKPALPAGVRAAVTHASIETYAEDEFTCAQDAGTKVTKQPVIYRDSDNMPISGPPSAPGDYTAEFACIDEGSNRALITQSITLSKPVLEASLPSGTLKAMEYTNDPANFDYSAITCTKDGEPFNEGVQPNKDLASLPEGSNEVTFTCSVDIPGETIVAGTRVMLDLIVDTMKPQVTVASAAGGVTSVEFGGNVPTITAGMCTDENNVDVITINNVTLNGVEATLDSSVPGTYVHTTTCEDKATNTATGTFEFVVQAQPSAGDTTAPVLTATSATAARLQTGGTFDPTFTCLDDGVTDLASSITGTMTNGDATTTNGATPRITAGNQNSVITYFCTDGTNVSNDVTVTIVIDNDAPTLSAPPATTVYQKRGVTIPTDGGLTCSNSEDTTVTGSRTVDINVDGSTAVTYSCTDEAGNVATQVITYIVDGVAPVITPATGTVTLELGTDTYTAETPVCNDPPHAAITTINTVGDTAVDATTIGEYPVTHGCTDMAGNDAATVTRTFSVVDTTDPQAPTGIRATVSLTTAETYTEDAFTCAQDAGTTVTKSVVYKDSNDMIIQEIPQTAGTYSAEFTCTDAEDNSVFAEQSITITQQGTTTTPVFALSGDLPDPSYTNDPANFDYTAITCTKDATPFNDGVQPNVTLADLAEGSHPVTFECKEDGVGEAPETESIQLVVDKTDPVPTAASAAGGVTSVEFGGTIPTITAGMCTDDNDGVATANTVTLNGLDATLSSSTAGTYVHTTTCEDKATNTATGTFEFTVQAQSTTQTPAYALTGDLPNPSYTNGTVDFDHSALTCTKDGADFAEGITLNVTIADLEEGSHPVLFECKEDGVGAASRTIPITLVVDRTPPTVFLIGGSTLFTDTIGPVADYVDDQAQCVDNIDETRLVSGEQSPRSSGGFLVYDCTDAAGNVADSRGRFIFEGAPFTSDRPTVFVNGDMVNHMAGTPYSDNGVWCFDTSNGEIDTFTVSNNDIPVTVRYHDSIDVPFTDTATLFDVNTPGEYTLDYSCENSAGRTSLAASRTVTVAEVPPDPVLTLHKPEPGPVYTRDPASITSEDLKFPADILVCLRDGARFPSGLVTNVTLDGMGDGRYAVKATCEDGEFKAPEVLEIEVVVDTIDPVPPVVEDVTILVGSTFVHGGECEQDDGSPITTNPVFANPNGVIKDEVNTNAERVFTAFYVCTDAAENFDSSNRQNINIVESIPVTVHRDPIAVAYVDGGSFDRECTGDANKYQCGPYATCERDGVDLASFEIVGDVVYEANNEAAQPITFRCTDVDGGIFEVSSSLRVLSVSELELSGTLDNPSYTNDPENFDYSGVTCTRDGAEFNEGVQPNVTLANLGEGPHNVLFECIVEPVKAPQTVPIQLIVDTIPPAAPRVDEVTILVDSEFVPDDECGQDDGTTITQSVVYKNARGAEKNSVNTNQPRVFTAVYECTDLAGNSAESNTQTINIENPPPRDPGFEGNPESHVSLMPGDTMDLTIMCFIRDGIDRTSTISFGDAEVSGERRQLVTGTPPNFVITAPPEEGKYLILATCEDDSLSPPGFRFNLFSDATAPVIVNGSTILAVDENTNLADAPPDRIIPIGSVDRFTHDVACLEAEGKDGSAITLELFRFDSGGNPVEEIAVDAPGEYTIQYRCLDEAGNNVTSAAQAIRIEHATGFTAPESVAVKSGQARDITLVCRQADGTDISGDITVTSGPAVKNAQTFTLTASGPGETVDATFSCPLTGGAVTHTITIVSDDEPPVIFLRAGSQAFLASGVYNDEGAVCVDNFDPPRDIAGTPQTLNAAGIVNYNCADSAGNDASQVSRQVFSGAINDQKTLPIITVSPETVLHESGTPYLDSGVSCTASPFLNINILRVERNDGSFATEYYDSSSTPFPVSTDLVNVDVPGDYILKYTCADPFGNSKSESRTITVIDRPDLALGGSLPDPSYTNSPANFDYTALTCTRDGTSFNEGVQPTMSLVGLAEDEHTVTFKCVDRIFDSPENETIQLIVDRTNPVPTAASAAGGVTSVEFGGTLPVITAGTCADDNIVDSLTTNTVTLNGADATLSSSTSGTYIHTITCTDEATNTASATFEFMVLVDPTIPVYALSGTLENPSYTNNPENFDYSALTCTKDGADFAEGITPNVTLASLAEGSHPVTFECKEDGVGEAPETESIQLVVDTIDPVPTVASAAGGVTSVEFGGTIPTITAGTCADENTLDLITTNTVTLGGAAATLASNAPGTYVHTTMCEDKAGNDADDTFEFTVLPKPVLTARLESGTLSATEYTNDPASLDYSGVTCEKDGEPFNEGVKPSVDLAGLAEGSNSVTFSCSVEIAGETITASTTVSIELVVDKTDPVPTAASAAGGATSVEFGGTLPAITAGTCADENPLDVITTNTVTLNGADATLNSNTAGTYVHTTMCTDKATNTASATFEFMVQTQPSAGDTTAPVLTATSATAARLQTGGTFDPTFTCLDDGVTDLASSITGTRTSGDATTTNGATPRITAGNQDSVITYSCTDGTNVSNDVTVTIVIDNDAPTLSAPAAATVYQQRGVTIPADGGLTCSNSEDTTVTGAPTVDIDADGSTPVTYSCTDEAGNAATQVITYVVDGTDPVPTAASGPASITFGDTTATVTTGSCSDTNLDSSRSATVITRNSQTVTLDVNTAGMYLYTTTCTDLADNVATATFTATVEEQVSAGDTTTPVLARTSEATVRLQTGGTHDPTLTCTDDGTSRASSITGVVTSGDATTTNGATPRITAGNQDSVITYSCTDGTNVSNDVTVTIVIDNDAPTLSAPAAATVYQQRGVTIPADGGLTCSNSEDTTVTGSPTVAINVDGSTPVTYSCTDEAGNAATQVITYVVDGTDPVPTAASGPASITFGDTTATVTTGSCSDTNHDSSRSGTVITRNSQTVTSLDVNTAGMYLYTTTCTDLADNVATATFTATVQTQVTTQPATPGLTYGGPSLLYLKTGATHSVPITCADAQGAASNSAITSDSAISSGGPSVLITAPGTDGNHTITYSCQSDTEVIKVVVDGTSPVFDTPEIIAIYTDENRADFDFTPTCTDANLESLEWTSLTVAGSSLTPAPESITNDAARTYTLLYECTDRAGNSLPPNIFSNPGGQFHILVSVPPSDRPTVKLLGISPMYLDEGDTFTDPQADCIDPAGDDSMVNAASGTVDTSVPGTYVLDYYCFGGENADRSLIESRTVIVHDLQDGIPNLSTTGNGMRHLSTSTTLFLAISCHADDGTNLSASITHTIASGDATSSDGATPSISVADMDSVVDFRCTDGTNNSNTVSISITVDNDPPMLSEPAQDTVYQKRGVTIPENGGLTCTDTGGDTEITQNPASVDINVDGNTTVTYFCLDEASNSASEKITYIVDGTIPTVNAASGPATIDLGNTTAMVATGTCDDRNIDDSRSETVITRDSQPVTSLDVNTLGAYLYTTTCTDLADNTATATFTTTVVDPGDVTPPTITINGLGTTIIVEGQVFVDPGATCVDTPATTPLPVTVDMALNNTAPQADTYTITYSCTDGTNPATAQRTLIVLDPLPPYVEAQTVPGECPAGVSTIRPVISFDADGNMTVTAPYSDIPSNELISRYLISGPMGPHLSVHDYGIQNGMAHMEIPAEGVALITSDMDVATYTVRAIVHEGTSNGEPLKVIVDRSITRPYYTLFDSFVGLTVLEPGGVDLVVDKVGGVTTVVTNQHTGLTKGAACVQASGMSGPDDRVEEPSIFLSSTRLADNMMSQAPLLEGFSIGVEQLSDVTIKCTDIQDGTGTLDAYDPVDTSTTGTKNLVLRCVDSEGNETTVTGTVVVGNPGDTKPPVLTVNGFATVEHVQGQMYTDAGATCVDSNFGTLGVTQKGMVDVATTGTYTIEYFCSDSTGTVTASRTINVVLPASVSSDTTPPVASAPGATALTYPLGVAFVDPPIMCTDAFNGDINTFNSSVVPDIDMATTQSITYSCIDAAGNRDDVEFMIMFVDDTTPPQADLRGDEQVSLPQGSVYMEQGATCEDAFDLDNALYPENYELLPSINATGLDLNRAGEYEVEYTCIDRSGNLQTKSRTVQVLPQTGGGDDEDWTLNPTFGRSWATGELLITDGFGFNGRTADIVDNFHTEFPRIDAGIGSTHTVTIKAYSDMALQQVAVYLGVPDLSRATDAESDIIAEVRRDYNLDEGYEIVSIEHEQDVPLVDEEATIVTVSEVKCRADSETMCYEFEFSFRVMAPLSYDILAFSALDTERRVTVTYINDGVGFVGESLLPAETTTLHFKRGNQHPVETVHLTQDDRRYNLWSDQHGFAWLQNEYGSWFQLTHAGFERLADPEATVMTRSHSDFADMVQKEQARAALVFNSTEIESHVGESFSHDAPVRVDKLKDPIVLEKLRIAELAALEYLRGQ